MGTEHEALVSREDGQTENGIPQDRKLPVLKRRAPDTSMAPVPLVEKTFELPKLIEHQFGEEQDIERDSNRNKKINHKVKLANLTRGRLPPNPFDDYMYSDESINNDINQFPPTVFSGRIPPVKVQVVGLGVSSSDPGQPSQRPNVFTKSFASTKYPSALLERGPTIMKKLPLPRKNGDIIGSREMVPSAGLKGFVLRNDKFESSALQQMEDNVLRASENMTQRERLAAEMDYAEEMRNFKRKKDFISHREPMAMGLGGHRVVLFERIDIMGELARLKHVRLPAKAKELYVGRGFRLPNTHALNNPNLINMKGRGQQPSAMSDPTPTTVRRDVNSTNQSLPTEGGSVQSRLSIRTEGGNSLPHQNPSTVENPQEEEGDTKPSPEWVPQTDDPTNAEESENKLQPHNPLKNLQFKDLVTQEELQDLEKAFEKVLQESSGSITYDGVRSSLPSLSSEKEEEFIKEIYQLSSKDSEFGLGEFVALTCTCNTIERLTGPAKEAFNSFSTTSIEVFVHKFMDLFESIDRHGSGKVKRSSFEALLSTTFSEDTNVDEVLKVVNPALSLNSDNVTKSEFLALTPYFSILGKDV